MRAAGGTEPVIDFEAFEALTFDCYGTLIDWESGILTALATLLAEVEAPLSSEELLELFGRLEADAQRGAFRSYREVLTDVATQFGKTLGLDVEPHRAASFAASVSRWPPFSDSIQALRVLASRYRLAIVSNVDDDLFWGSQDLLEIDFAEVVTANQVRSYKPDPGHFREVLSRLDLPTNRVLHVAQSLFHDIAPAMELGFTCVWVNRRAGRRGGGATLPAQATPELEVPDLASLVRELGLH